MQDLPTKQPGIGDNQPSPVESTQRRVDELIETANRWINNVPEITSAEQAGRADDFVTQLTSMKKAVDDDRLETTKPLRDDVKRINDEYGTLTNLLDAAAKRVRTLLSPWMDKLEAERKERERKQREEADRLAREAAEKAAAAARDIRAEVEAKEAAEAAEAAKKKAESTANASVSVKGELSERSRGTRQTWKAAITDINAAIEYYKDRPELWELLTKLGSADARSGRRRIPGFNVYSESKVS